ncbi:MAG TPA: hypothetical protein VG477_14095 [Thermoanaerobaculia bacterium]|nr:hypothetical protein [Thermoanaerobaculia bacterium]
MIFCRPMLRNLAAAIAAVTLGLAPVGAQVVSPVPVDPACLATADPLPIGLNAAPLDSFADPALFPTPTVSNDYHWMHSSVHLQGAAETEKWGACVFFNPDANQTAPVDMRDWRSAVVVNNPSPTVTVNIKVTYRDPQGNFLASIPATLAPEATFVRGAVELRQFGQGIGSVQVTADHPIVGATIHHFDRLTLSNGEEVIDRDYLVPGANSMQQLQKIQDSATLLYSGPFPAANNAPEDFLNGVLPLNCVVNPNPTATTVTMASFLSPGTPLGSQTVTLQPHGMFLDTSIWAVAEPFYLTNPAPFSMDIVSVAASSGNPIVGDFLMVDVFGNGGPANLEPGGRFRMGSGMMQIQPALRLLNPEHIQTSPLPGTPPVTTMMSVANVTAADIGPVSVDFFPRNGGAPTTFTIASLPAGTVQRITPSNFAIPQRFAGWARIRACQPGLIGWTMREVEHQPGLARQFHKVYGEELDGANLDEPGKGLPVQVGGQPWVRKVAPLLRAAGNFSNPNWWPSYQTGVNHANPNLGQYWHRFFTLPGLLAGQQTFAGLRFANTSFTYVDPIVTLINNDANVSGRFDSQNGPAIGMEAIGDPLREWSIPLFLGPDVQVVLGPVIGGTGEH